MAYVMRDALISVDATEYQAQCNAAELTPQAETLTMATLDPGTVYQDVETPTWTLRLAGVQDMTPTTGLARYLTDNHGQQVTIRLEPKRGGTAAIVTAIAKAVPFGGERNQWATFDVELPVEGQPQWEDPA